MLCKSRANLLACVGIVLCALLVQNAYAVEEQSKESASVNAVKEKPEESNIPPWLRGHKDADKILPSLQPFLNATKTFKVEQKEADNKNARVVFSEITLQPDSYRGQRAHIGIQNIGKAPIDLIGWRITNKQGNDTGFVFQQENCGRFARIPEGGTGKFFMAGSKLPCELNFTLNRGETLSLYDEEGQLKANVKLDFSGVGEWKLSPGGNYWLYPYTADITTMQFLDKMGNFKMFTQMLRKFKYDRALAGLGRKRWQSCGATGYYPFYACTTQYDPAYDIYYRNGPFTVFAPSDTAMKQYLKELGGPHAPPLSIEEFLNLDDGNMAKELLLYHVINGTQVTSRSKPFNTTTPYIHSPTHRNGTEIVTFTGSHGRLWVHEDCVESYAPDEYGCEKQVEWGKCGEDWMNDEGLFSKRKLGYCEVTCGKCKCTPDTCKLVTVPDIKTTSGVVHVIDHVLPVPAIFKKYVPPPPPPPPPPPSRLEILNRFPTFGDVGLTRDMDDQSRTIEDLIELYLASRRSGRNRSGGSDSARVIDGLVG